MKQNLLSSLRKELENTFGRRITASGDCIQMVEDIYKNTGQTVNANTLRRFFGLVKADYPPSSSTLNILARYCGFNSIDEIEKITSPSKNIDKDTILKEEVLRYLVALFRNTQVSGHYQEMTFYPLVEQTIIFLERNSSLIDKFQREIAKTPTGQYYYYEKLANMDRLNGYYGDGLRHYLRAKNTEEGKVFAHAMQVFRYWLTKNNTELAQHISEITPVNVTADFPSHILGRYIAARLYHANVKNQPIDAILAEAKRFHGGIKAIREDSPFSFPDFELIICEALLLTGNYEEGSEYIWHGRTYLSASGQDKNTLFNLWEDFAGSKKDYKSRKSKNNPEKLPFYYSFSKKYNTIIELLSANANKRSNPASDHQFSELIRETGYKRLLSQLL